MKNLSCDFDPTSISVATALEKISQAITVLERVEQVAVGDAAGRVLAEDVVSMHDVPNHTNSAMDGYAVRSADLCSSNATVELQLVGTAFAGSPFNGTVLSRQCVRIMTGAVMPQETDTVVIQEQAKVAATSISVPTADKQGSNVRYAGEDIKAGEVAVNKGTYLHAAQLGIIASLGVAQVAVYAQPKVAFFSNGDELKSVGEPLALGEVYDSNRYTLKTMIEDCGAQAIDFGVVKDNRQAIETTLKQASEQADIVISTAGASVGEADYIKAVLEKIGQVSFMKVAVKPGRPLSFGKIGRSVFFGLPGNPVSVMVTFQVFVKAAISKMSGENHRVIPMLKAKTLSRLKKRPGRMEYQRGLLSVDDAGETTVQTTGDQGSGILSSMGKANCFVLLEDQCDGVEAGEWVQVQLF